MVGRIITRKKAFRHQVLDDDVGKDDLLGSVSISMIGILQSQVGEKKGIKLDSN